MLASYIICHACGCKGTAGNTLHQNQSESPVFRYLGHDPFEGTMRYACINCKTTLLVDPMDMLTSSCARGAPGGIDTAMEHDAKARALPGAGKFLHILHKKLGILKYH